MTGASLRSPAECTVGGYPSDGTASCFSGEQCLQRLSQRHFRLSATAVACDLFVMATFLVGCHCSVAVAYLCEET